MTITEQLSGESHGAPNGVVHSAVPCGSPVLIVAYLGGDVSYFWGCLCYGDGITGNGWSGDGKGFVSAFYRGDGSCGSWGIKRAALTISELQKQ